MKKIFLSLLLTGLTCATFAQSVEAELEAGMKAYNNNDGKTAVEWFRKAATKGSSEAMFKLGVVFGYQQYGVYNADSLNFWFKKAWLADHPKAKTEWLMLRRDRRMDSMADWKTLIENKVNVGQKQWVSLTTWSLVADDRYYSIGPIYNKKTNETIPSGATIYFRILDKKRLEVANGKSSEYSSYTFRIAESGDYAIEAYYDCSECTSSRKPSGFTMLYRMAMWNYDMSKF
jgi:TPR repeat protein